MKTAIIENYLQGLKNPPRTTKGLASLIRRLTGEMGFSPLPDDEISRLTQMFYKPPNKPVRAKKNAKPPNALGE